MTRFPVDVWRGTPWTRQMAKRAVQKILAVAQARNIAMPEDAVHATMEAIDDMPPEYMASMHEEMIEGRPSELEYQNGAVVRLGRETGVPTPVNEFIYYSLLPQEMKARGQV